MKVRLVCVGLMLVALFSSCNREVKPFVGDYSYKISGNVCRITPKVTNGNEYDTTYQMVTQRGQMKVMRDMQRGENHLLVTLNEMNGGVCTLSATVRGDSLFFDPYTFVLSLPVASDLPTELPSNLQNLVYEVQATGAGFVNRNMILMKHQWSGVKVSNNKATLKGNDMTFVAERN